MKPFRFLLLFFLLSSCAFHSGMVSTTPVSEEYIYEDIGFGVCQTSRVFGLGGLSKDAMVLEAKRQLYKNRPLLKNEMYANLTVDFKRTNLLIYNKTVVTVSADIVLKTDSLDFNRFSKNYLNKLENRMDSPLFQIGDTVMDKKQNKGVIIGSEKKDQLRILYSSESNYRTKKVASNRVFAVKETYNGLRIGEKVDYPSKDISGIVVGFSVKGFLLQDKDGATFFCKYSKTETKTP